MIAWLSDWLKQILAVLLFAAVVDLLVPGKAYERYTRLALGLIILTAMLGPVLKLFREDPERLLGRSLAGLGGTAERSLARMPDLDDIRSHAEALRGLKERQAGELAARAIEASIREAVHRLDGPKVREVRVTVGAGREGAEIEAVSIVLEAAEDRDPDDEPSAGTDAPAGAEGEAARRIRIEPVDPVARVDAVRIRIGTEGAVPAAVPNVADGEAEGRAPDGLTAAPEGIAAVIRAVVHQGWGVKPERISVWMPA